MKNEQRNLFDALDDALAGMSDKEVREPKNQVLLYAGLAMAVWFESPDADAISPRMAKDITTLFANAETRPVPKTASQQTAKLVDDLECLIGTRAGESEGAAFKRYLQFQSKLSARLNAPEVEVEVES